jgi:RHS repeat-associated protein
MNVKLPDGTSIEYVIDATNRRIGRKVNGVYTNRWLYGSGLTPIADLDSASNIKVRYLGAFIEKDGTIYRIVSDNLGSVRQVVNTQTGEIVQKIDYDEFGNIIIDTNPEFQPFGYAGGLYDHQTKLVRFGARDYDAINGRWTAKDPIGFDGGMNQYSYVTSDPINSIDPEGKSIFNGPLGHVISNTITQAAIGAAFGMIETYVTSGGNASIYEILKGGGKGAGIGAFNGLIGSIGPKWTSFITGFATGVGSNIIGQIEGGKPNDPIDYNAAILSGIVSSLFCGFEAYDMSDTNCKSIIYAGAATVGEIMVRAVMRVYGDLSRPQNNQKQEVTIP